jgi:hypothetical protein
MPAAAWVWTAGFFLFSLLLTACGNNKNDGIEAVFVADFNDENPSGDNDSYPDSFLSPNNSIVTVGVKSVSLIMAQETDPSYTIFDTQNGTTPLVLDLTTIAQSAAINNAFPSGCPCDFSQVRVELTYFELQVPVYVNNVPVNQRFRFYTLDLTDPLLAAPVNEGDVLVGDVTSSPHFSWIDTSNGAYISLATTRPTVPLQVPASRFPDHTYSSTVTIDLPTFLHIPSSPKGTFAVKLTVHAGDMFFFDDTDGNGRFDLFTDGLLDAIQPNSHFYPLYPTIDAAAGS